jgi:hypothetical protein
MPGTHDNATRGSFQPAMGDALAAQFGMVALHDLGTGAARKFGRIVVAVVCNHQQAIGGPQLPLKARNGWQHVYGFVVGRHQHGDTRWLALAGDVIACCLTFMTKCRQCEDQQGHRWQRKQCHDQKSGYFNH